MFCEKCAQQFRNVPLSNNMVSPLIADISEGLITELIKKVRKELFSLQIDKATDFSGSIGYLIGYHSRIVC
jgi:hypothetical protein